jgi:hypothetical protein
VTPPRTKTISSVDEADPQLSRDVLRSEDRLDALFARGPGGVDADRFRPRVIREPQGSMKQSRNAHVVDVGSAADGEVAALVLDTRASDSTGKLGRGLLARGEDLHRVQILTQPCSGRVAWRKAPPAARETLAARVEERLGAHHDSRCRSRTEGRLRRERRA